MLQRPANRPFLAALAFGILMGIFTHHFAIWLCIGIALGAVLSGAVGRSRTGK